MSTQKHTHAGSQPDADKLATPTQAKKNQPLSEQELKEVSGGLNPQPLPPMPFHPTETGRG